MTIEQYEKYQSYLDYIKEYAASTNAATGSKVDANANVECKNVTTLGKVKGPHVLIYGLHTSWDFDEKNFKAPVQIKVSYTECSPNKYGFDFYKENLSYDDLVIFLRETIGVAMDEDVLRLFLKK